MTAQYGYIGCSRGIREGDLVRITTLRIAMLGGILLALMAGGAYAALVKVNGIVLKAEGSFAPKVLPKRAYAPITLKGHVNISTPGHRVPPAVTKVNADFSDNGKLQTKGLATCSPDKLQGTTPGQARRRCEDAIVGTGNIEALVHRPGEEQVPVRTPLTIFNGPPQNGLPTVVFHTWTWYPESETYVVTAPIIKRQGGPLGFHIDVEVPPIAEGYGSITHADIKVGKTYTYKGHEMSYTSARCSDGVLEVHGRVTFAEGTVIEGELYQACSAE